MTSTQPLEVSEVVQVPYNFDQLRQNEAKQSPHFRSEVKLPRSHFASTATLVVDAVSIIGTLYSVPLHSAHCNGDSEGIQIQ